MQAPAYSKRLHGKRQKADIVMIGTSGLIRRSVCERPSATRRCDHRIIDASTRKIVGISEVRVSYGLGKHAVTMITVQRNSAKQKRAGPGLPAMA
jgi:hypothetical protein